MALDLSLTPHKARKVSIATPSAPAAAHLHTCTSAHYFHLHLDMHLHLRLDLHLHPHGRTPTPTHTHTHARTIGQPRRLVLTMLPADQITKLQRAADVYDRIASKPRQGAVSDMEVRLFLAGQGCSSADGAKAVRLLRSLMPYEPCAGPASAGDEGISFWQFATGFDWVVHSFKIYGVNV
jgi:hypothetical protein